MKQDYRDAQIIPVLSIWEKEMTKLEKYQKKYRQKNRLKRLKYSKKYYRDNKEKCSERSKRRYRRNRKAILVRMHRFYKKNRNRIIKRSRKAWLSKSLKERRIISRRSAVKYLYKLTASEHVALLEKQNYKCPVSGLSVDIFSPIDHDHACCVGPRSCGKCIRGIIHSSVNWALGAFVKPEWLLKAYDYVTE
jgi:hypothetical protein